MACAPGPEQPDTKELASTLEGATGADWIAGSVLTGAAGACAAGYVLIGAVGGLCRRQGLAFARKPLRLYRSPAPSPWSFQSNG